MSRILDLIKQNIREECSNIKMDESEIAEKEIQRGFGFDLQPVAEWEYNRLRKKYSHLDSESFLKVFNSETESNRCLVPRDFPLSQKEFQIAYMQENENSRPSLNEIAKLDLEDMDCFYGLELPQHEKGRKYFLDMAEGFNKVQENSSSS